jgi:hypothetical protein
VELLFGVRMRGNLHTPVVDHDLIHRLDIVIDEHLFTAHNSVLANFYGIQPTHANICKYIVREIEVDIGYIVETFLVLDVYPSMGVH